MISYSFVNKAFNRLKLSKTCNISQPPYDYYLKKFHCARKKSATQNQYTAVK